MASDNVSMDEALKPLFAWQPPKITPSPQHTRSHSTRPPKPYDMHLHKDLRLKRIDVVPDMLQKLSSFCDELVGACPAVTFNLQRKLVTYWESIGLFNPRLLKQDMNRIKQEATLVQYYKKLIGNTITQAATLVMFQNCPSKGEMEGESAILKWCDGILEAQKDQTQAIADAFVQSRVTAAENSPHLDADMKANFKRLAKFELHDPIPHEFKNIVAGDYCMGCMEEIAGPFSHIVCQEAEEGQVKDLCGQNAAHRDSNGRWIVTGRGTSPDGTTVAYFVANRAPEGTGPCLDSAKLEGKHLHCKHLVQQGWAEAVRNDSTFIFFSSGNIEYIGIRDRQRQTLFISKRMEPDKLELSYAKILLGMYISAFEDAIDRATMLEKILTKSGIPFIVDEPMLYTEDMLKRKPDDEEKKTCNNNAVVKKKARNSKGAPPDPTLLNNLKQTTKITLYLNGKSIGICSPFDTFWVFSRTDSSTVPVPKKHKPLPKKPNPLLALFLQLEKPLLRSSKVFEVLLSHEDSRIRLMMKVAKTPSEILDLIHEHDMYMEMRKGKVTGILEQYGLFSCEQDKTKCFMMLMEYGGTSLSERVKLSAHIDRHWKRYQKCVRDFCERYIHGAISPEHLLMDITTRRVFIISLAHSKRRPRPETLEVKQEGEEDENCLVVALRNHGSS